MTFKHALVLGLAITASACSTVTIQPKPENRIVSAPNYQESKPFYLFGTIGENRVNVTEVCGDKGPVQMQSQQTFLDGLATVFTLGIYAPHTVKVWCK
jgi:hypothetical protein